MNLTLEQIKSLAHGAADVEKVDGEICLYRFNKAQRDAYLARSAHYSDFYKKALSTAGVSLEFDTDSETLCLSVSVARGSSRSFFVHSVFVDGVRIGELSGEFAEGQQIVQCEKSFFLDTGVKRVRIVFPWSAASRIRALTVDDGARVSPVQKRRTIVQFGDSITQGYDAMWPENAYSVRLAQYLDADGLNKGIGAEIFWPELALLPENRKPDLITVAYGTNDWSRCSAEEFLHNSQAFYRNLRKTYPDVKIVALAPTWRADNDLKKAAGPFAGIAAQLAGIAAEIGNAVLIDCVDLIPHDRNYYSDRYLHPNDQGFRHYAEGLCAKIAEVLDL